MLHSKSFTKISKKGALVNVLKQHYLRDDIGCSLEGCYLCPVRPEVILSGSTVQGPVLFLSKHPNNANSLLPFPHYVLPDTNIFLHQMDLMEHPYFRNVIIAQTVLEEVKHINLSSYQRLRALIGDTERRFIVFSNEHHRDVFIARETGESPNDRNDRALRRVASWYNTHIERLYDGDVNTSPPKVIFLTEDQASRTKALESGLMSLSVKEYVASVTDYPELSDVISSHEELPEEDSRDKFRYPEHHAPSLLHEGLKLGKYWSGTIAINPYNLFEGKITIDYQGNSETVYIKDRINLNRAMNGDAVVVQILPEAEWIVDTDDAIVVDETPSSVASTKPTHESLNSTIMHPLRPKMTGKVVGILKRSWRTFCGSLDPSSVPSDAIPESRHSVLFTPIDRRVPKIRLSLRRPTSLLSCRLLVTPDAWPATSLRPIGHFVRSLGLTGDKNTETTALLYEHDVPTGDFSKAVMACVPDESWTVGVNELSDPGREDLRHLTVCSIDPPGCTDIDDALHVREMDGESNKLYEVGVHIADVTHFVTEGTAVDLEAANRGTTVYLVDRRIDMLPSVLGTNLCSLKSNIDRLAFSCIWVLNENAEIINVRFTKSIIRSKASFTYDEAQARLENPRTDDPLSYSIKILDQLAKRLRARRIVAGALTLASPEVRFSLENDSQDPVDVELKALKDTNALVEEFMLLANISVAKCIFESYPDMALLRRHPTPPKANFDNLVQAVETRGLHLDVTTSRNLAESLDQAVDSNDSYVNTLIRILTTRCMMQAVYFCAGTHSYPEFWHYGLASPIYTHFTSPIRRYADVVVHRLLAAHLAGRSSPWTGCSKQLIQEMSEKCNFRHRMAQQASRSSVELYTYLFFKCKRQREEAYVMRVMKNGLIVLIPRYGIEGQIAIPVDQLPTHVVYEASMQAWVDTRESRNPIKLVGVFDKLDVEISMEEKLEVTGQRSKLIVKWKNYPSCLAPVFESSDAPSDSSSQTTATSVDISSSTQPDVSPPPMKRKSNML